MSTRPKPSITVDERGILLHLTNSAGEGIAIPLSPESLLALVEAGSTALAAMGTERGKKVIRETAKHLWQELLKAGKGD